MKKYKSKFEESLGTWFSEHNIPFEYEPCQISYTVPETTHKYIPDWKLGKKQKVFYESKGFFALEDRKKMLFAKVSNPDIRIRIIFQNSTVKIRKGSKTTYADWATQHGFDYFCWKTGTEKDFKKWLKSAV